MNVKELLKKERLPEAIFLGRAAEMIFDGANVNLGIGYTSLIPNYALPGKVIHYYSENGIYEYGSALDLEDYKELGDHDFIDTSGFYLTPDPGLAFSDILTSMQAVQKVDFTFLGFLQVSEKGDLANHTRFLSPPDMRSRQIANVGGGMDMVSRAKRVVAVGNHVSEREEIKILRKCSYPLTGVECVDTIITDLAFIEVTKEGLVLKEIAPGWRVEEIQALTEPKLMMAPDLKEMTL
ncbi:MAG: CoA-transferase [Thermodesulfobacteriota bacterium]|nr:CoA-transferase [Thermodesulfobacteriota bacterium]